MSDITPIGGACVETLKALVCERSDSSAQTLIAHRPMRGGTPGDGDGDRTRARFPPCCPDARCATDYGKNRPPVANSSRRLKASTLR
jgi:hypothetical protein